MQRLDVIEQVVSCTNCELHARCTAPVAFRGPAHARIAIVGEAPGRQEDDQGQPFVGPSGALINELLAEVDITEEVAFVNTVSCYPHGTPTWDHINACAVNKATQLQYLEPIWVLLLGRVALKATRPDLDIKRGRGRPFLHQNRIHYATYHPAAALRRTTYADSLRDDLVLFKTIVDAGDEWWNHIPDSCAACPLVPALLEETGLGWCPVHMPGDARKRYETRVAQMDKECADARARTARTRADQALAAVEANADPRWMDTAWAALVEYLETHTEFFVDDFWSTTKLERPRESRALGPLVLRAGRERLMEKSGQFRKSTASNMTEKPVWKSLIYGRAVANA